MTAQELEGTNNPPAKLSELEAQFDRDLARELVAAYLEDTQDVMEKMQEAIFNRDEKALKSTSHMLKVASRIVVAEQIEQLSSQMEEISRSNNWLKAESHFDTLNQSFDHLVDYLRSYLK
jgi:HPt (histidine-containing phosphotransfer) domain-containing protein